MCLSDSSHALALSSFLDKTYGNNEEEPMTPNKWRLCPQWALVGRTNNFFYFLEGKLKIIITSGAQKIESPRAIICSLWYTEA